MHALCSGSIRLAYGLQLARCDRLQLKKAARRLERKFFMFWATAVLLAHGRTLLDACGASHMTIRFMRNFPSLCPECPILQLVFLGCHIGWYSIYKHQGIYILTTIASVRRTPTPPTPVRDARRVKIAKRDRSNSSATAEKALMLTTTTAQDLTPGQRKRDDDHLGPAAAPPTAFHVYH